MTAITPDELSVTDLPMSRKSGTARRRALVVFNGTNAAGEDTINLATYVSGLADIEGIMWQTYASGIASGTANTWSTTTLTVNGTKGAWEFGLLCNLT
jgi:hypothetical protein